MPIRLKFCAGCEASAHHRAGEHFGSCRAHPGAGVAAAGVGRRQRRARRALAVAAAVAPACSKPIQKKITQELGWDVEVRRYLEQVPL